MPEDVRYITSAEAFAAEGAQRIVEAARQALAASGCFSLVLSGGRTPEPIYERLAATEPPLPWESVHVFWGDERCVPPSDPRSNFAMAHRTLLSRVPLPEANVHRIRAETGAEAAAALYEAELRAWLDADARRLDMVLLGLGPDGHTASLFPGDPVLDERQGWVKAVGAPTLEPRVDRVTMTLPLINAAQHAAFLIAGEGKSRIVAEILAGREQAWRYPAARIQPAGRLTWLVNLAHIQERNPPKG